MGCKWGRIVEPPRPEEGGGDFSSSVTLVTLLMQTSSWTISYMNSEYRLKTPSALEDTVLQRFHIVINHHTGKVMYRSQQTNHSQTAAKMTAVWVLSFLLYSPAIIFWEYLNGDPLIPEGMCVAGYYYSWYFLLGASTFDFFLPLTSISYFNLSIYWNLRMRSRKRSQICTLAAPCAPHENTISCGPAIISNIVQRRELRTQTQLNISQTSNTLGDGVSAMKLSRDKKVAQSLTVLVCVFGICWAPYTFLQTIRATCHDDCVESYWNQVTSWMLWINSSVNPIIYPLCHKSFRDALVKISQKCKIQL
ncbi:histamine H3 receptor-like [Pseudophryne corroboree]|uniref:histamine H3 receptor-like n=1 Tax=Pseudophryne corroboree TaxID=495146 RepID=UPI003081DA5C